MTAGRPSLYREGFPEKVIELGRNGKSLTQIAAELGISKETLYDWCRNRAEFSDAISRAIELAQAFWEDVGQRAVFGEIQGFNHQTYNLIMRNRFRPDYGEVNTTNVNVSGLPPASYTGITFNNVVDPAKLDTSDLEALAALLERQKTPVKTIDHESQAE